MKKLLSLAFFLPMLAGAQNNPSFTLKGNVAGLPDGLVQIRTAQQESVVIASDSSRNGSFNLKGAVTEPGLYFLVIGNWQPEYLYLDNTNMQLSAQHQDQRSMKIEGSQAHLDFVELNTIFNPMMAELSAVSMQLQKEADETAREKLMLSYDSVLANIHKAVGSFVEAKRSSPVSPFLLWITSQVTPDVFMMEKNYLLLDSSLYRFQMVKDLGEYIAKAKVGAVGTMAPDFTQNDMKGSPISLSSFRGQFVLIDFWASWCGPCRKENPNLVKTYNRFKDKNFTILGVSLDQDSTAWANAVKKDNLTWTQVSDLQFWSNAAAQLYKVESIPGNFLVDPTGKIVARDLRGAELDRALEKFLGKTPSAATPSSK